MAGKFDAVGKTRGAAQSVSKGGTSSVSIWAALLTVYLVWGSTYLAIRIGVESLPPFLMAGARFLVPGAILFAFRRLRRDPAPTPAQWRSALIIALFMLVGGNGMVTFAEQRVPSGLAALMVASAPLWMVLMDLIGIKRFSRQAPSTAVKSTAASGQVPSTGIKSTAASEQAPSHGQIKPTWKTILGVVVGFAGIALLVGPSELTGMAGEIDPVGGLVLSLAGFCWAAGSLYSRGAELPGSPLMGTSMEMLAGGAGLILLGSLTGEWGQLHLQSVTLASVGGLAYLIVFGSLVGYTCYTWLLRSAPTALVSTYAYVNPLVAIFLGSLLAQEPITPRVLIATVVILGAVGVITFTQSSRKRAETIPAATPSSGDD